MLLKITLFRRHFDSSKARNLLLISENINKARRIFSSRMTSGQGTEESHNRTGRGGMQDIKIMAPPHRKEGSIVWHHGGE